MFYWTIKLLSTLKQSSGEPIYHIVTKLRSDPGLEKEDELWVNCKFNFKEYHLKTKVVGKVKNAYDADESLKDWGEEAVKNGLLIERIVVEAEDRDAILEISEFLQKFVSSI
jgi:hypothetical protein